MKTSAFKMMALVALLMIGSVPTRAFLEESVTLKVKAAESGSMEDLGRKTTQPITGDTQFDLLLESPVLVSLKGRIPMLLVPVKAGLSEVTLNPPLMKDLMQSPKQKEIDSSLSDIMVGISTIQKDIQKRDVENASFHLDELRKKYPEVVFLEFIRASILVIQGQKAQAREIVTRALQSHPDYKDGQEFLKALGGAENSDVKDEPKKKSGAKK